MRNIRLTKDMKPYHQGQNIPLPEDLAEKIVNEGRGIDEGVWATLHNEPSILVPSRKPKQYFKTKTA